MCESSLACSKQPLSFLLIYFPGFGALLVATRGWERIPLPTLFCYMGQGVFKPLPEVLGAVLLAPTLEDTSQAGARPVPGVF